MRRDRVRVAFRASNLTLLEQNSLLAGVSLIVVAAVGCLGPWTVAGAGRFMALAGLTSLLACAAMRGVRLVRSGTRASVPTSVGRTRIRIRPSRGFAAIAVTLALVLPLVSIVGALALIEWAWLPVAGVLLLGCAGICVTWERTAAHVCWSSLPDDVAVGHLQRLCIIADLPVPSWWSSGTSWRAPGPPAGGSTSPTSCWICSPTMSSKRCSRTKSPISRVATLP